MANQSLIGEFWEFLKVRKRYWLLPIVIMLCLLGMLIVFTEGSAIAPFIYALFQSLKKEIFAYLRDKLGHLSSFVFSSFRVFVIGILSYQLNNLVDSVNPVKVLKMQIENITAKDVIFYLLCVAFFSLAFGTTPFTIAGLCILLVWFISGTFIKNWKMYFEQAVTIQEQSCFDFGF